MTLPVKLATACAALFLGFIVLLSAAAAAVTATVASPLSAVWHAITGDPSKTQTVFTAEQYMRIIGGAEQNAPSRAAATAVAFAARQIGLPYIWGGNGEPGYNCSGLTQAAYSAVNVDIPRTATAQYQKGPEVSLSALRPGDLVFYGSSAFAHHVAIYVGRDAAGAGVVLDAPHTGAVVRLDPLAADDLFGATRPGGPA